MTVDLSEAEWNAVLNLVAMGPWREANPLLMKIGEQMRTQRPQVKTDDIDMRGKLVGKASEDRKEANHG